MRVRHIFVAWLVLFGCSQEPAPEDSYFITIDDYNEVSVDTVDSAVLEVADGSAAVWSQPDTISLPDSSAVDSLMLSIDSLMLSEDTLAVPVDTLPVDTLPLFPRVESWRLARLEIQGSLYQTLGCLSDVNPDILGAHCVRHLVWEMNPWNGFIAGDSLIVLYDTSPPVRENMVMAFRYIPVAGSANHSFSGYVFTRTGDNWPSIWKPDGTELVKLMDRLPVSTFEEITSVYGEPRGNHTHAGIDFKAPEGTPVFSVTGGTVVRTDWNTTYNGRCVEIDFGGYSELFLHLSDIEPGIAAGVSVAQGDQVGTVGNTGISSAPHLHYQINGPDDYSIDPYLYFSSHRRTLTQGDMEEFSLFVDACRARMDGS